MLHDNDVDMNQTILVILEKHKNLIEYQDTDAKFIITLHRVK